MLHLLIALATCFDPLLFEPCRAMATASPGATKPRTIKFRDVIVGAMTSNEIEASHRNRIKLIVGVGRCIDGAQVDRSHDPDEFLLRRGVH